MKRLRCCRATHQTLRPYGEEGQDERLRVVRGGAYNNEARNVRCAYRNRNNPHNRNDNQGFRVVVSHAFPCNKKRCSQKYAALLITDSASRHKKNGASCSGVIVSAITHIQNRPVTWA